MKDSPELHEQPKINRREALSRLGSYASIAAKVVAAGALLRMCCSSCEKTDRPTKANSKITPEKPRSDLPNFPHGENYLNALKNSLAQNQQLFGSPDATERREELRNAQIILESFLRQALNHSAIFETRDGTKFPYTVIRVDELAADLLNLDAAKAKQPKRVDTLAGDRQTFIFPSALQPENGHPFTFVEYAMEGAVRALPDALAAARAGRKIDSSEFVIFGSPTQESWGAMSPRLRENAQKDAFGTFGKMYADAIRSLVPSRADEKNHAIKFEGSSMGASFAASSAAEFKNDLQKSGAPLPDLSVRMDAPVGLAAAKYGVQRGEAESAATFLAESVWNLDAAGMNTFFGEEKFLTAAKKYFARCGGMSEVAGNSPAEKQAMIDNLIAQLGRGVPVDPELRITAIEGESDLLLFPFAKLKAKIRRGVAGVFGESIPKKKYPPNVESRVVLGGHNEAFNFARPEKVAALWRAAQKLDALFTKQK